MFILTVIKHDIFIFNQLIDVCYLTVFKIFLNLFFIIETVGKRPNVVHLRDLDGKRRIHNCLTTSDA